MTSVNNVQQERWRQLVSGVTIAEIAVICGISHEAALRGVASLKAAGAIRELPDGRWRFVASSASDDAPPSTAHIADGVLAFLTSALHGGPRS